MTIEINERGYNGFALDNDIKPKSQEKYLKQLRERGYDDTESWNLDHTIMQFILPRLKTFRQNTLSFPGEMTHGKWMKILDRMILGVEYYIDEELEKDEKYYRTVNIGLGFLVKYFSHLWD